jgi:uncharacterized membrane protein YesL
MEVMLESRIILMYGVLDNIVLNLERKCNIEHQFTTIMLTFSRAIGFRDVQKVFYYIFHIKPHFKKTLFQVDSCSILMIFLPTKTELNLVLHCNFSILL